MLTSLSKFISLSSRNDSSDGAQSKAIPDNILAFRTITTLLEMIQRLEPQPFKLFEDGRKPSDSNTKELRLSTAFSTLAVIDHEVVAVVAKRTHGKLEIIACTNLENQPITQSQTSPSIFQFLFTKGSHKDDLLQGNPETGEEWTTGRIAREETRDPIINGTECPPGLEPGDKGLKEYLEKRWSNLTLPQHLHILSRLFAMQNTPGDDQETHPNSVSDHFMRYVIATCYPKMKRRLNHPTLSLPYVNSLKEVKEFSSNEPLPKLSDKEIGHDRRLLLFLYKLTCKNSQFHEVFPEITRQAKLVNDNQPFQLYSTDTQKEFHDLLITFLQHFQDSLKNLSDSRGPTNVQAEGNVDFKRYLEDVVFNGLALQNLSKSSALRTHLKAIEPLLHGHRVEIPRSMPMPKLEKKAVQLGECGNHDENDEELEAVQPYVTMERSAGRNASVPLWKSYEDWLRLLVTHFDAVDLLVGRLTGPHLQCGSIDVSILVAPNVDNALLPWQKLFATSHFPTATKSDENPVSNADILEFFYDAISASPQVSLRSIRGVKTCWEKLDKVKLDKQSKQLWNLKQEVKALKKYKLPGWEGYSDDLTDLLNKWTPGDLALEVQITNMIRFLIYNAEFFDNVETMSRNGFSGTLHCEACLASLLDHRRDIDIGIHYTSKFASTLAEIKTFGRVIGVSKYCCPTCRYLLHLLAGTTRMPFVVRGSHSAVTACTLPTWLPRETVDSMNEYFGGQLRQGLTNLIHRTASLRDCTQSTGSRRLSSDSLEEHANPVHVSDVALESAKYHVKY